MKFINFITEKEQEFSTTPNQMKTLLSLEKEASKKGAEITVSMVSANYKKDEDSKSSTYLMVIVPKENLNLDGDQKYEIWGMPKTETLGKGDAELFDACFAFDSTLDEAKEIAEFCHGARNKKQIDERMQSLKEIKALNALIDVAKGQESKKELK